MPSPDTLTIEPIKQFAVRYITKSQAACDPFARNCTLAHYTNDLNPNTAAAYHLDAEEFLQRLLDMDVRCDCAILDPPYSPRQISECYAEAGIGCGMQDTQNAGLYRRVRDVLMKILTNDAVVLSFGWNSAGMGIKRGFQPIEIMLCCHGGAHNDTICLAEQRTQSELDLS